MAKPRISPIRCNRFSVRASLKRQLLAREGCPPTVFSVRRVRSHDPCLNPERPALSRHRQRAQSLTAAALLPNSRVISRSLQIPTTTRSSCSQARKTTAPSKQRFTDSTYHRGRYLLRPRSLKCRCRITSATAFDGSSRNRIGKWVSMRQCPPARAVKDWRLRSSIRTAACVHFSICSRRIRM